MMQAFIMIAGCMDMSIVDGTEFSPSGISPLVFLFPARAPIMVAFFAQ